jgi:hypothetical protein
LVSQTQIPESQGNPPRRSPKGERYVDAL